MHPTLLTLHVPVRSAQRVIDGVAAQGVRYIFGVPGAKVDEVYDVLAGGGPELVVCRLRPGRARAR